MNYACYDGMVFDNSQYQEPVEHSRFEVCVSALDMDMNFTTKGTKSVGD